MYCTHITVPLSSTSVRIFKIVRNSIEVKLTLSLFHFIISDLKLDSFFFKIKITNLTIYKIKIKNKNPFDVVTTKIVVPISH